MIRAGARRPEDRIRLFYSEVDHETKPMFLYLLYIPTSFFIATNQHIKPPFIFFYILSITGILFKHPLSDIKRQNSHDLYFMKIAPTIRNNAEGKTAPNIGGY